MLKVKKYLRGSGRVLAFVFIASVIWLLFDMAALRISINDANSQLLKERVVREREIFKQQSRVTVHMKRSFKNPIQRVDLAVTPAGKGLLNPGINLADVYRQGGKKPKQRLGEKQIKFLERRDGNLPRTNQPKYVLSEHKESTNLQSVTRKQVPVENNIVNLDLKRTEIEKNIAKDDRSKVRLPVVSNDTKGVQETKKNAFEESKKGPKAGDVQNILVKTNSKKTERTKDETKHGMKEGELETVKQHPGQITYKPQDKDVNDKKVNIEAEEKHVRAVAKTDLNAAKETTKPIFRVEPFSKDKTTSVKKTGLHKVQYLDATLVPRDPKAMGQFGQSGLVGSSEDAVVRKRWDEGFFNVYLSDQIPVDRAIPDTRPDM